MFDLKGRVAFITGGNGGIGLGMAKGLAAAGASVVIAGRNKAKAKTALAEIAALGGKAEFAELDVLQEASCKQAIDGARASIRPARHPGQQCRHQHPQAAAGFERARTGTR